jgi:hypothetical protein
MLDNLHIGKSQDNSCCSGIDTHESEVKTDAHVLCEAAEKLVSWLLSVPLIYLQLESQPHRHGTRKCGDNPR